MLGNFHGVCRLLTIFKTYLFIFHLYSNMQIYILQYNHDGIQKKVKQLIQIMFFFQVLPVQRIFF